MSTLIIARYGLEDVSPQAIFWRPIKYFSMKVRSEEDELDRYEAVAYLVGNHLHFELRAYAGHPPNTVTLYLSFEQQDSSEIGMLIDEVIKRLVVPKTAVAWRRGQPFEYGRLDKPKDDRLYEREARILALKIAATFPNRTASTDVIKQRIPEFFELSPTDMKQSTSRASEQRWQQIVGNVISHRSSAAGPFLRGYAERTHDGLRVTNHGMDYLKSMGFSS